ncbi:Ca2+-binding RTX toxin-like protein [Phyllobacterium trifolii]|uniref:Ca2+-binding RTX toxin-like protein n=1 Tax=Phyllobacterium trifolii TaxID=300193 RepID=A0A839U3J3_9HYPH|nr:calcium-binding protein [Phyllobacterium trifolii]MBB3145248.1 Ca2+-binding RTX toxin-like protein [Phyllobacterium trifolii]
MALDPALFSLLGIYNGTWSHLNINPLLPVINGTEFDPRVPNSGNDEITLSAGINLNLRVNGLSGNDFIDGRGFGVASRFDGGDGSDQIYGGAGINTINGDNGNDYIDGGGGADRLTGGAGMDTVSYASSTATTGAGITLTLSASGGASFSAGNSGAGADVILGGFENVVGTNLNDTITGNAGNNILIGLGGNNVLKGMGGDDTLIGGAGINILDGGLGNDRIIAGAGSTTMYGGGELPGAYGDDVFIFGSDTRSINIDDFHYTGAPDEFDKIDLSAIDADVNQAGKQTFTSFVVTEFQSGYQPLIGELVFVGRGAHNLGSLIADTNGDGQVDVRITFGHNSSDLVGLSDFIL